jgi:glutathione S-transferase
MIDLYTVATSNGQRASIALEECGLAYRVHLMNLPAGDHKKPAFLALNPIGKAPVLVDHDGPGGQPITVFETAAMALYCAEKAGKLIPADLRARTEMMKWIAVCISDLGPAFSAQFWFSGPLKPLAGESAAALEKHFIAQAVAFLGAVDGHLARHEYLAGDAYSLADAMMYPTATSSVSRLPAGAIDHLVHLRRWRDTVGARPGVERGMKVGF